MSGEQPDMQQLMVQAQQMQQHLMAAQAEISASEIIGESGNGLVTVTVKGTGELISLNIDPKVVDPTDVDTLQDLVIGAINDAAAKASQFAGSKLGPIAGGTLPGFGLG